MKEKLEHLKGKTIRHKGHTFFVHNVQQQKKGDFVVTYSTQDLNTRRAHIFVALREYLYKYFNLLNDIVPYRTHKKDRYGLPKSEVMGIIFPGDMENIVIKKNVVIERDYTPLEILTKYRQHAR